MLGNYWLLISAILAIVSVFLHQVPLLLISLLFFLAGGAARLWGRYCLSRVEYRRHLSANRVFFGEEVQVEIEVANRKPMPIPWIHIEDEMPGEVTFLKGKTETSPKPNRVSLNNHLSLSWYHRVKRRYSIRCLQRGYFAFGPARIRSGDIFGFFRRDMDTSEVDYLMVYPRILPLDKLGIPSKQPLGEIRTAKHVFQDPILTMGVRDYHFGDSLKRIHWKSTARLGQLQTKVFEPTTTVDMGIFLDVRTTRPPLWGCIPELLELSIVTTASIANYAIGEGFRAGLYVNQSPRALGEPVRIPPSQHPDQFKRILETLAQMHEYETMPINKLVLQESRNLPWNSTMVLITAMPTDPLMAALLTMKRAGRRVALIMVGSATPSMSMDGLTVYHVRDNVPWNELDRLNVAAR